MNRKKRTKPLQRPLVRGWRWKIAGGPNLPVSQALAVSEAVRYMAMEVCNNQTGANRLPDCLHGPYEIEGRKNDKPPKNPKEHPHAFWLAEDHDGDGLIDHILVHADAGLSTIALTILLGCRRFYLPGRGDWRLIPQWMGSEVSGNYYGPSHIWRSRTPWFPSPKVHRLHIERELELRGLPGLVKKTILEGNPIPICEFVRKRTNGTWPPAPDRGKFLLLELIEPHFGPLSLGFEAHFGLGQFEPVRNT